MIAFEIRYLLRGEIIRIIIWIDDVLTTIMLIFGVVIFVHISSVRLKMFNNIAKDIDRNYYWRRFVARFLSIIDAISGR